MVISIKNIRAAEVLRQYRKNKRLEKKVMRILEWIKGLKQNAVHLKGEESLDVFLSLS